MALRHSRLTAATFEIKATDYEVIHDLEHVIDEMKAFVKEANSQSRIPPWREFSVVFNDVESTFRVDQLTSEILEALAKSQEIVRRRNES